MDAVGAGQQLGAYLLIEPVGRGGMGVVFRAQHAHLGRTVALKLLAPELAADPGFRERFLRESRSAAQLDHPNVVTVYDAGEVDGALYLAMRFVEGTDLAALLQREAPLEPGRALAILEQVGAALDAAHACGLVHRDVKPGNVMIEGGRCYLTDFGLTKPIEAGATALTAAGQFLGTLDYIAPEQIEGRPIDGRADIYALGCVLFECLTGSRPYPRDSDVATLYAQLREPPPRPSAVRPELPAALDRVVATAMAKLPEERYPTCAALVEALRAALAKQPTRPSPRSGVTAALPQPAADERPTERPAVPDVRRHRRRRGPPVGALVAAVVVAVAIAAVAVVLLSGGDDKSGAPARDRGSGSGPSVKAAVPVGSGPVGVTAAGGSLWVANNGDDTVTRLSLEGRRRGEIDVGRKPFGVASAAGTVWVANSADASVDRIDAQSGRTGQRIAVGESPYFAAAGKTRLFVTNGAAGSVSEFVLPSGTPRRAPFAAGPEPRGIAIADDAAWVASRADGTVWRISHGLRTATIKVGAGPVGVTAGSDAIWVANKDGDSVSRIDVASRKVRTADVGDAPVAVAVGAGFVWVASSGDDTVVRLDEDTGRPVGEPVEVPGQPTGIAVAGGSVWVTANDRNELVRIEP